MTITGGFAGHGFRHGISVNRVSLERICNDCGYSWPSHDDERTRIDSHCADDPETTGPEPDSVSSGICGAQLQ